MFTGSLICNFNTQQIQIVQSKDLRSIRKALWHCMNQTVRDDLKINTIQNIIKNYAISIFDKIYSITDLDLYNISDYDKRACYGRPRVDFHIPEVTKPWFISLVSTACCCAGWVTSWTFYIYLLYIALLWIFFLWLISLNCKYYIG